MTHAECNFCTREKIHILAKAWDAEVITEPLQMPREYTDIVPCDPVTLKLRYKSGEVVWVADLMSVTPHCVCGRNWSAKHHEREAHLQWCKLRALECLDNYDIATAFSSLASDLEKHEETRGHSSIRLGFGMLATGQMDTPEIFRQFVESVR